jgi:hypothetical protein
MAIKPSELDEIANVKIERVMPEVERRTDDYLRQKYSGASTNLALGVEYPYDWNRVQRDLFERKFVERYQKDWKVKFVPCYEMRDNGHGSRATQVFDENIRAIKIQHKKYRSGCEKDEEATIFAKQRLIDLGDILRKDEAKNSS